MFILHSTSEYLHVISFVSSFQDHFNWQHETYNTLFKKHSKKQLWIIKLCQIFVLQIKLKNNSL